MVTAAGDELRGPARGAGYLPYIDGLRAVAVLAVVAYHLHAAWLPGGFAGVDVFFVISGFVVGASVARLGPQSFAASLLGFYARRLRRIAPALVACLLLTGLASALFIPQAWLSDTSERTGLMAFLGLSNWVLAATGNDYFSPKSEFNPYTHTWSLGVEEQFYVLFPLLFFAWTRQGARWRTASAVLFAAMAIASLAFAWHRGPGGNAFYLTGTRLWELGAGVLLFQAMARGGVLQDSASAQTRWPPAARALRSAGIALSLLLLAGGIGFARPGHTPWPDASWPVLGTLGLLWLLHGAPDATVRRLLSAPAVVAVGKVSYSLYLWHWPVFVLFRWTVGLETPAEQGAALLLAVALSVASYHLVEKPMRHAHAFRRMAPWRFVAASLLAIVVLRAAHAELAQRTPDVSLSVVSRDARDWYPGDAPADANGCTVRMDSRDAGGAPAWLYARAGCEAPGDAVRIFVAGDSHAAAYSEMLQRLVLGSGRTVTLYAAGGCPVIAMQPAREREAACRGYLERVLADVGAHARAGDVLFLPSLRLPRLSEQWMLFDEAEARARLSSRRARASRNESADMAVAALAPLARRGVRIVLEAPTPLFRAPAYRCSDWFNRDNPVCARGLDIDRRFFEAYRAPVVAALEDVAARLPGTTLWDPLPALCPGATCRAVADGRPLFFDGDHLSGHGNRTVLPSFAAHVDAIVARGGGVQSGS